MDFAMDFSLQLLYAGRMILAGICGAAIGYERENRQKPAGVRTHVIVGVTSALMMLTSKYGFSDVLSEAVKLDPSRMAAGVVTAIGFLGSGVIFARNKTVSGITTSAGIWATVGVGLAVGAGQYFIGIVSTAMVLAVEALFGRKIGVTFDHSRMTRVTAEVRGSYIRMEELKKLIEEKGFRIYDFEFSQKEAAAVKVTIYVIPPKGKNASDLLEIQEEWLKGMELKGKLV